MSLAPSCSLPLILAPFLIPGLMDQVVAAPVSHTGQDPGNGHAQAATSHRHFHAHNAHPSRVHKHRRLRRRQDSDPGTKKTDRIMGTIDIVLVREDEDDDARVASLHVDCTEDPCAFDITNRKPTPVFLVKAPEDGYKFSATADGVIFKPVLLEIPPDRLKHKDKAKTTQTTPQCVTYRIGSAEPESSIMTIEPCSGSQSTGINVKAADSVKSQIFAYQEDTRTIRPFWLAGIQAQQEEKPVPVDLDDRALPVEAQNISFRFKPSSEKLTVRQEVEATDPAPVITTITSTTTITLTNAAAPTAGPEGSNTNEQVSDPIAASEVPTVTTTIEATDPSSTSPAMRRQAAGSLSLTPVGPPIPTATPVNATEVAEDIASQAIIQEALEEEGDKPVAILGEDAPLPPSTGSNVSTQADTSRVEFPEAVSSANINANETSGEDERTDSTVPTPAGNGDLMVPLDTEPYVWKFEEIGSRW